MGKSGLCMVSRHNKVNSEWEGHFVGVGGKCREVRGNGFC